MSAKGPWGKSASDMIVLGRAAAVRVLCEHAFTSILKDYADVMSDNLGGLMSQGEALGFRLYDVTRGSSQEAEGTLLYREVGDKLVAIAFISLARSPETGGVIVEINRLDKDRMDILELRETTTWN